MNYSVLYEKCIPVTMTDGTENAFGIYDALIHAHEIQAIQCNSPLESFALLRLLTAFSMDMLQPKGIVDRQDYLDSGAFDEDEIKQYIRLCEKDGPRFDLFDASHPFMLSEFVPQTDEKALKSASALSIGRPSGNNHVFLDHRLEEDAVMTPAEAFRATLALYLFCTAGAQGYPSGVNNTPPVYSCINGKNLYETIILNMTAVRECAPLEYGAELVPWRRGRPVVPKEESVSISLLEGLTWQPRRITLFADEDGQVRRICLQQGKNFRGNDLWRDPFVSYRYNEKSGWNSVKPQAGRALWRDVGTLITDKSKLHSAPPLVIRQAAEMLEESCLLLSIHSVAMVTNQASYVEWMEDDLSLPVLFFKDYGSAALLRADVDETESMQSGLRKAVNTYFCNDKKHSDLLSDQAQAYFLSRMHDVIFGKAIPDLLEISTDLSVAKQAEHVRRFGSWMKEALEQSFRNVVECGGTKSDILRNQVEAYRYAMNIYTKNQKEREAAYE